MWIFCPILNCRDYQLATKAIELLKERGFEMDFNALMKQWKHFARNGDIKSIENSLYFFIKYNMKLRVKDMLDLIYELSAHGYPEHVNKILIHMNNAQFEQRRRIAGTIVARARNATIEPHSIAIFYPYIAIICV